MKTAVVLAGGLGSRLRPYTVVLPKPLMPIGDIPILEAILRQLKNNGFGRVVLAVNYQANLIRAFFGDGERLGIDITYSLEQKALGTMGPLHLIDDLPDNFIVMNGDILCNLEFGRFFDDHVARNSIFTISASRREQMIDYGVLEQSEAGNLTGFREKPKSSFLVSMGVYAVSRRALDWIPKDEYFGFDQLMLRLIADEEKVFVDEHSGYWLDIGRPDDYHQAVADWPKLKEDLGL
ncbi:sugar phosphate nucleotidyltransferase [Amorphus coralli]|uniref:sugar phosphate nucleotidyltransferase n=1 Tax=Amorphus coralli TaxID=340680 RepID=UPI00036AD540|nr:sugar phosphate nucleotidyltransferase [Amorphus coralli]